jgi:hypothetical protein
MSLSSSDSLNLTILFSCLTSDNGEVLTGLSATFLQTGNLNLPDVQFWAFCVLGMYHEYETEAQGKGSINAFSGATAGFLTTSGGLFSFEVDTNRSFVQEGHFVSFVTTTGARPSSVSLSPLSYRDHFSL